MRTKWNWIAFLSLLACTMLNMGCGDSGSAQLRVVHASPDAPNVDVLVNGNKVLTNVAYEGASTYLKVSVGQRRIEVRPTGTSTDVIDVTPTLAKNTYYTVLAVNKVANIMPLLLQDDNTPPASGQVKVRFIHAAPSAPNVDIYVGAPGSGATGTPAVADLAYMSASGYLSVPAGSYEAYVTPTGTTTVAIDSGALTLGAGQIRTAVALDAPGGGAPFTAIVLKDLN